LNLEEFKKIRNHKKIDGLGIPYMGSKRKLASQIVNFILEQNPNTKYFYDLFGGGGSISFDAVQRLQVERVFYNEFNTGVVSLLKDIKENGVRKEYYDWVSRKEFHEFKDKDCWKAGLIKTCWSFGNSQKGYLFSQENEKLKRPIHEIIVNKSKKERDFFYKKYGLFIPEDLFDNDKSIHERRLDVIRFIKKRIDLEQLGRLQQLEQLEQLGRLQQLGRFQNLEIYNLSYDKVKIETPIEQTVIYCDPPYKGTGKYEKDIDHEKFFDFVKNSPFKIYVSGYDFDLSCVLEMEHRVTLSSTNNSKKIIEKLFCNKL
jgi:site-specific DNA-adenine methylase